MARDERNPLVRVQLYQLLGGARDPALARRALALALTDEPGATNSGDMIQGVAGYHTTLAFDFALAHRAQVDKFVDASSLSRYYPSLAEGSLDPAMPAKVRAFAQAHIAEGSRRPADTAVANIEYRLRIHDQRLPAIDAWLGRRGD